MQQSVAKGRSQATKRLASRPFHHDLESRSVHGLRRTTYDNERGGSGKFFVLTPRRFNLTGLTWLAQREAKLGAVSVARATEAAVS